MSWLETHLTEFVEPYLGEPFNRNALNLSRFQNGYFSKEELTVIKNSWRSVKRAAKGKPVLLPGRDVFIYEVLAQREKYPTLFVPEISRLTVRQLVIPNLEEYFMFDTGFVGSIPKNLGTDVFKLLSYSRNKGRYNDAGDTSTQVFPRLTFSRGLALKIEGTPKYWETARIVEGGRLRQDLAPPVEFEQAARLTVEIFTNSAPKFVKKHKPLTIERRWTT